MADEVPKEKSVEPASNSDVVLIGPPTADGAGNSVLRMREGRVETGQIRCLEQGKPIAGEVVSLTPRKDEPRICDVRVEYDARPAPPKSGRPAQVATDEYRKNWEAIFRREPSDSAPN